MRSVAEYRDVRDRMVPGDIVAFGGKGAFSNIIKMMTKGPVSHVGVVLQTVAVGSASETRYFNNVIESTSLKGFSGVTVNRLSDRLRDYDGDVWWLPLSRESHKRLDQTSFFDFLFQQQGKRYDLLQAVGAEIDWLPEQDPDFGRFFCSELVVAGLQAGGLLAGENSAEMVPIDVCRLPIFAGPYAQLAGIPTDIPGWNSE